MDVRLYKGVDGKVLVCDSSENEGVGYVVSKSEFDDWVSKPDIFDRDRRELLYKHLRYLSEYPGMVEQMQDKPVLEEGDLVKISDAFPLEMDHFIKDKLAIVVNPDPFNKDVGSPGDDYGIWIEGNGERSWYDRYLLKFLKSGQHDLLREWKRELECQKKKESNLDWIFSDLDLTKVSDYTIRALADCLGLPSLWGPKGEGITYYTRSMQVLNIADRFLKSRDKEGWLKFCEENKGKILKSKE
jgi:hypothetical protein